MAELTIKVPEQVRAGFEKLEKMNQSDFGEMLLVLNQEEPTRDPRALFVHMAKRLESVPGEDIRDILETGMSFFSGSSSLGLTHAEFVDAILNGYDNKLPKDQRQQLYDRLTSLLASETLHVTSKALDLLVAQPNSLTGARIITDLRMIFHDDPNVPPTGALVIHQLRLSYHGDSGHKEFYIALDSNDLKTLKKVIERAEAKAQTMMNLAQTAHLYLIEEDEEGE